MIEKIVKICNVGKFRACHSVGDLEFRRSTLVYADNGRGKSTLCDILRSLQDGSADVVVGRTTLGGNAAPEVVIRSTGATHRFADGQWNQNFPELVIFDGKFIQSNVYVGDLVGLDQRRGLHSVIVGSTGVQLAAQIEDLDRQIRQATQEIGSKRAAVQTLAGDALTAEAFCALPPENAVEEKIEESARRLDSARQAGRLASGPLLEHLTVPELPTNLGAVLAKGLDGVAQDAEARVIAHQNEHMRVPDDRWLARGTELIKQDTCPFCGQGTSGILVVAAFKAKFSDAYNALAQDVERLSAILGTVADAAARLRLESRLAENARAVAFWREYLEGEWPEFELDALWGALRTTVEAATARVLQKRGAPLAVVELGADFEHALTALATALERLREYNTAVERANARITAKQAEVASSDVAALGREVARLTAVKLRHSSNGTTACGELAAATGAKAALVASKEAARRALDAHSGVVFSAYQSAINAYLERFGAGFRIGSVASNYVGGQPQSTYTLVINDCDVQLGDARTPLSVPSFKNTVSAGDKSTLALAFFLAQVEALPQLTDAVVVLDDPFSSQDRSRRECTKGAICDLAGRAKQVVVLSHDAAFLKLVSTGLPSADVKTLQLVRMGDNTTITRLDLERELEPDYFANHRALRDYRDGNASSLDKRSTVRCIRPVLEANLRFRLPGEFDPGQWLGQYIDAIRNAPAGHPLEAARDALPELTALNDYSKRFHHAQNPNADNEPIVDGELLAMVRRTIALVGGF